MPKYFSNYWNSFLMDLGYNKFVKEGESEEWHLYKIREYEVGFYGSADCFSFRVYKNEDHMYQILVNILIASPEDRDELRQVLGAIAEPKEIPLCIGIWWAKNIVEYFLKNRKEASEDASGT